MDQFNWKWTDFIKRISSKINLLLINTFLIKNIKNIDFIFGKISIFWPNLGIFVKKYYFWLFSTILAFGSYLVWVLHKANRLLVCCWVHLSSGRYIPHRQGFSYNSIPVRFDIWIIYSQDSVSTWRHTLVQFWNTP